MPSDDVVGNLLAAIASSVLVGGFLYYRLGQVDNSPQLSGFEWYWAALLLAGFGFAGFFSVGPQIAAVTVGLMVGPTLVYSSEIMDQFPTQFISLLLLPAVFLFSVPPAVLGTFAGVRPVGVRTIRSVHVIAFASALILGVAVPEVKNRQSRTFQTAFKPNLLKEIYSAEMSYRMQLADGTSRATARSYLEPRASWVGPVTRTRITWT